MDKNNIFDILVQTNLYKAGVYPVFKFKKNFFIYTYYNN